MNVHRDLERLPNFKNAVITIGTFDGVHTGHQKIIQQLHNEAKKINGETIIITFHPHPRRIIGSKEIKLINTLDERIELLSEKKVDHLVIIPFTEVFSRQSAEEYIHDFLVKKFHPHTIIIGYDHRYGKNRKGDYHLLAKLSQEENYILKEIPPHISNEISVSSTRIRDAVIIGDIETATELLGYHFFFEGRVIEGNRLGRTIGYPTANLKIKDEEKLLPGDGVYAVEVTVGFGDWPWAKSDPVRSNSLLLKGMMNIGYRPTIDGKQKTIEVNIFDFDEDIYGKKLRVYVKKYLRGEQKFNGLDELKEQLAKDKVNALKI
ncbi:MAG TPA: bifunctional riboflavin kinase/FAD synthetase [Puia sp.]|nr:bifunctional riboflavin kinase/FAD synthetase [Puia sp.]